MSNSAEHLRPILATMAGIALFSAMDAVMKSASIAVGAYSAYLLRCLLGFAMIAPFWLWRSRRMPEKHVMRVHIVRGVVVAFMGWTFFASLVRLPLAEAIAISFVAPLIALFLAAWLLGEKIERRAIIAAILGLAGVMVIVGGRIGRERMTEDAVTGLILIGVSALLYAWNLVLQRQQALVAGPVEVSTFQNGIVSFVLLAGAPFLLVWPEGRAWLEIGAGAALAVGAALFLAWAYARAEAQRLVPIEYTGFLWASLFGWLYFGERVGPTTVAGAVLIVIGCWIATRRRPEQRAL
ncbi:DMT family transporter [Qipengyuania sp. 1XM1-15A]|uniref:DMT family transporter n=1 Tax=Qipengyuania xiamenensis TaxID=2867237 RepID=UPI001C8717C2|nr:DMT family transporter [Qipengyuania xiamenensis]MBX7533672.1 DMT family transporter [Qipengyuania xiamenensis]